MSFKRVYLAGLISVSCLVIYLLYYFVQYKSIKVISPSHQGKLDIFLLAGQSNMQGDGDIATYDATNNRDGVYVFNEKMEWVVGKEPVREKVGPSMAFASKLIEDSTAFPVGIVNVSKGATSLNEWLKGKELYNNLLLSSKKAAKEGEIKALLFFQGENDTDGDDSDFTDNWHIHFETFVKNIRNDLGIDSLPVIFAQIGKGNYPYWENVRESQKKVNLNNVSMIVTDDIPNKPNSVHFLTEGYMEIGRRFARCYSKNYAIK